MGERGIGREAATPEDIDMMRRLTEEALRAGAFGFTTSRTYSHKTKTGDLVPAHGAEEAELTGIGRAIGAAGAGAFGMNSDFEDEAREFAWMTRLSKETGRPVWFLLTDRADRPGALAAADARRPSGARRGRADHGAGRRPPGRGHSRPQHLDEPVHVPPGLSRARRICRRRSAGRGCATRRCAPRILAEPPSERRTRAAGAVHPLCRDALGPHVRDGQPARLRADRRTRASPRSPRAPTTRPDEIAYDYLTEGPDNFLFFPVVGYVHGDHEQIRELLLDPATLLGPQRRRRALRRRSSMPGCRPTCWRIGDATAAAGRACRCEHLVRMQTSETADFFGFRDRGRLKPGLRADINLIDFDRLRLHQPEIVHDLPAGGRRLVQRVDGYRATLVAGTPIFENGEDTGARPGRLVRNRG